MKLSFMLTFAAVYALSTLIQYVASHSHINDFGIDIGKETIFKTKRAIAYRNKQRRHNDEDKTKTKFIVHIDNSKITSEEFVNHLHTYFNSESISESTIGIQSTTSSQNIKKRVVETHPIHHVLDGIIVSGLLIDEIKQLPHVVRVARETIVRVNAAPTLPWGLDRVNQDSLPLDGIYSSNYTGKDIDVYVVDTGIDTLHSEFQNLAGSSRIVKNIYNAFINPRTNPSTNTDDVGHGTHVSGTIGGLTVGLSPNANLYGLKILNSDGEGSSADVVLALDYVASQVKSSGRRSLVSMSLGGPCEDDTACSSDSVVVAVEHLSSLGIMVSVAAGNDGCNACYGSPNSAPHVITVGATDSTDVITYFSNYGSCVDILAPGYDVVSACASLKCGNQNSYVSFSGTSMACPHVSGMVAQILEKLSPKYVSSTGGLQMITIAEVMSELSCQSSKNKITLDKRDTITRNFLLHTPDRMDHDTVNMTALSFGSTYEPDIQQEATCEYTTDCINGCSNNGYCMPGTPYIPSLTHASSLAPTVAPTPQCYCSDTYYGASCGSTTDSLCTQHGSKKITVTMFDTYGDGWTFSSYAITDANGYIVDNGMDSLCGGQEAARQHCLPPGDYTFSINRGYLANEVAWFIQECSVTAGSPYNAILSISGGVCTVKCPVGSLKTTLTLKDAYGEGWNDAYYSIYYEQSGRSIFGGTLVSGETIDHTICLPIGCSSLFLESLGASPDDISMVICGKTIHGRDLATICIDSNLQCTATVLSTKPVTTSSTCPNTELTFYTMDPMLTGWSSNIFNISSEPLNTHITLQNSSSSGFLSSSQICLPDGCYDFAAINTMTSDSKADKTYWFGCEYFGRVPTISQICVEKKYGLCYGLQGCLYTKSYAHTTDLQLGFLTLYDKKSRSDKLISDFNIHGVNNLCALDDGCYKMTVGSGQLYDNISDRGQVQVCGNTLQIPFVVDLCIANNMTTCTATVEKGSNPLCPAGFIPQLLTKLSTSGLGWGAGGKYTINYYDPAIGANPGGVQQPGSGGGGSGGGGDGDGTDDIFGADDQMGGGYGAGYGGGYLDSTNEDRLISSSNSDYQNQQNDSDDTFHSILKQYRRQQRSLMKNTSPDQNKPSSSVEANNHIHRQITQKVKNQSKMHTMAGEVVQTGTLADGQIGFETFCLETNMCYTFTISSKAASSVLFLLCGYIGSGNTNKVAFCVSDNGCQFINSNEPYYDKSVDDDFPISIQQSYPTISPAILSHSNHPVAHSNVVVPPTKNISPTIGSPNSGIDPSDLNSAIQGSSMTLVIVLVLFFIISGTVLITLFAINYKNMRTDMFRYMSGSIAYDRLDNNDEEGRARFEMVNRGLSMDSSVHSNTVGIVGGTHVINPIIMSASRPGRTFEVVEIDDEADVEGGAIGIKGGSSTTISNGVNEGNNINTTSSSSTTNEISSLLKPT